MHFHVLSRQECYNSALLRNFHPRNSKFVLLTRYRHFYVLFYLLSIYKSHST